jgi:hypothetical protein
MAEISPIHALFARLLDGWTPQADEIDPQVQQVDALNWRWSDAGRTIEYQTSACGHRVSSDVVYTDQHRTFALTADAFLWLYDDEESEKVRFLEG